MLVVLTGSSGAGKTAVAERCASLTHVEVQDFDANGVPDVPSTGWRQRTLERWVQRAALAQDRGRDFLLSAPSGLAELSAVPSMARIDRIAVALIDVSDDERLARLRTRGDQLVDPQDVLDWAIWFRRQFADPRFELERVTTEPAAKLDWTRIDQFTTRAATRVVDTTNRTPDETAVELRGWIEQLRKEWIP